MKDDLILIEPADEQRQAFARWCLAQNPGIPTASATGSLVPSRLFTAIPDPLLDGALIDGHLFRPVVEGLVPDGDGYRPDEPETEVTPAPKKSAAPRQRTTRKGTSK